MNWKPIVEMTDLLVQAGVEVDLTVENAHGQISVTTAFLDCCGFGWCTNDYICMENPEAGDNRIHHSLKPLAWRPRPEPYNPYLIDGRYLIGELNGMVKTKRSTIEIKGKLIPLVEDHMLGNAVQGHFYRQWCDKTDAAREGGAEK